MQETHGSANVEQIWENEWGGKAIFSHGTSAARGIAIFVKKALYSSISNIFTDQEGRLIVFDIEVNEQKICLVAIYAPNEDKPMFFDNIEKLLEERCEHKVIIGDFNLTLDVNLDRENTYNNNNKAKQKVEELLDKYCLRDVWRLQYGEKKEFSWIKKGSYPIKASRIDFALVSAGLDQKVEAIQYLTSIKTDHRALYMFIETSSSERGSGYWKLNCSMLEDSQYIQSINKEISQVLTASKNKSFCQTWEILKKRIKKASINYAKSKVSEEKLIIAQLSEKVDNYESRLPLGREETDLWQKSKAELEEKQFERIKGVMFRSKANWYEQGEKNTSYFYSLEKTKYNAKTCYKIITEHKEEIVEPKEILRAQKAFYQELYQEDKDVCFNLKNTCNIQVPENIKLQQDEQITVNDLQSAIKQMKNLKTPGEDGLPIDFYKIFWVKLKHIFYHMVLECYQNRVLHATARKGILNLIPKTGKDSRFIKNLRPITLLNTDYKIIEKVIAEKMVPALGHIINKDQRGFMKDRRISVNIRKMLDIIHQAEEKDLEAVVLSLDFVKCFDKCSFSILDGSLEYFKFGKIVKDWTKILYKDYTVRIQNNGHFSEPIDIRKGVHQGGCCSSVYFLVIAEILAIALRSNQEIDGITIRDIKNLLNQFADDMDIFSMCNKKSLDNIFYELETFRKQSGFTVSYDKTKLYRIGSLRYSNAQLYDTSQVRWSSEDINVLGVTISHHDLVTKNYDGMVKKAKGHSVCLAE